MISMQEESKPATWRLILMLIVCALFFISGALLSLIALAFSGEPARKGEVSLTDWFVILTPFVLPISLASGIMMLWAKKLYSYSYILFFTAPILIIISFFISSGVL